MSRFSAAFSAMILLALAEVFQGVYPAEPHLGLIVVISLGTISIPALIISQMLRPDSGPMTRLPADRRHRAEQLSMSGPLIGFVALLAAGGPRLSEATIPPQFPGFAGAVLLVPLVIGWALCLRVLVVAANRRVERPEPPGRSVRRELRPVALVFVAYWILTALSDVSWLLPRTREALFNDPGMSILGVVGMITIAVVVSPFAVQRLHPARPLPPGPLRTRLENTARTVGVSLREIYEWETGPRPTINACVTGVLPAQRSIFLTDGILAHLEEVEIEGVFAHELAHGRLHHLWVYSGLVIGLTGAVIGASEFVQRVGLASTDGGSVDLVLLLLIGIFFYKFYGALSRHFESQADLYSADCTGSPTGIVSALSRIGGLTGALHRPGGWRHPPIPERIATILTCWRDPAERAAFRTMSRRFLTTAIVVIAMGVLGWTAEVAGRVSAPRWDRNLSRASYLTDAHEERTARPWSDGDREEVDLRRAVTLILEVMPELEANPNLQEARSAGYHTLAIAFDRLEDPWNAAAARYLSDRRFPSSR